MSLTGVDSLDYSIGWADAWLAETGADRRCAFRRRCGH
jgi:hypothetical protein